MCQFVILRHDDRRGVHFDLMVAVGGALKTWALPQPPQPNVEMQCNALGDHRLAYLDYEGPISGGRGSVTRWDRGTCVVAQPNEAKWTVELIGEKLVGTATLRRSPDSPYQWQFSYVPRA